MSTLMRPRRLVVVCSMCVVLAGSAGAWYHIAQSAPPDAPMPVEALPPLLAPPDQEAYVPHGQGQPIISSNPVAYLTAIPSWSTEESLSLIPETGNRSPAMVEFVVYSAVKYTGGGNTILVTASEPSPGANSDGLILGEKVTRLSNGKTAWISTKPGETPNVVITRENNLVITVAGNLPASEVEEYATEVVVQNPGAATVSERK